MPLKNRNNMTTLKQYDEGMEIIAKYLCRPPNFSNEAISTARLCLADALGCAILSLKFPSCTKLLGPVLPGTIVPQGSRVPGTKFVLDPIRAAFNIGTMIRWLDYNDTWLAAEWGHPSDNLGGLLAITDYLSQTSNPNLKIIDLLHAMIQAYEIQGVLALENSFNRVGLDHVILVKVATAAVTAKLLGASHLQIMDTLSNAWIDLAPLRTYRHAPNTGSRKSWAAGDATSRGVQLAWMVKQGEMGYPSALSTKQWGFHDVILKGKPLIFQRSLDSYVMENILFKVAFPAEFHAQTAVECAIHLHSQAKHRLKEIEAIEIETHQSALRIIDKKGALHNPADRDHCLQYMTAIGLIFGSLSADHYEEEHAKNPLIDQLRGKMTVKENINFTEDYLDPNKRSIANSVKIRFKNGDVAGPVVIEYPLGHRTRRDEAIPLIFDKLVHNLSSHYPKERVEHITELFQDEARLLNMSVKAFVELFIS